MPARSEPAAGSENSWHQTSSPAIIGPRWRCFWSSLPCAISVGPSMPTPITSNRPGTPARPISWLTTTWCSGPSPCPPYSAGHVTAASPAAASLPCHSRCAATDSASSRPRRCGASGACSSSQERTLARYSASSGVSLRSMPERYSEWHPVEPMGDGFADLPATVERLLTGAPGGIALPAAPERIDRVAVVLLDAFGMRFVQRHAGHPLLRRLAVAPLASQFPSTTTAHVTTMHTGTPVGTHGLYEWNVYEPALDAVITPILYARAGEWTPDGLRGSGDRKSVV